MSLGFLMFNVQQNITHQQRCYSVAFPEIPFVITTATLNCQFRQHGTELEKMCWNRLMRAKVEAIANSPFQTSIVVDTDLWPWNNERNLKSSVLRITSNHAMAGVMDQWRGGDIVDTPSLNGGFLLIKKCRAMDALWADVLRFLDSNHDTQEQWAYTYLLSRHPNVNMTYLHHTWSCGDNIAGRALQKCIFRHSHTIDRCPID